MLKRLLTEAVIALVSTTTVALSGTVPLTSNRDIDISV
jgi:hypothetical protein